MNFWSLARLIAFIFFYFPFVLQVQGVRFSCLQQEAGGEDKTPGGIFIKTFKGLIEESLQAEAKVDQPIAFLSLSRIKLPRPEVFPIYMMYEEGKCLIDCGKSYIFCAVNYVPAFLDDTKSFPASTMTEISQIFSEPVMINLQELFGPNILQLFENILKIEKDDRIKVFRSDYVIQKSSWIHFLLKGPPSKLLQKKSNMNQFYFSSGLKDPRSLGSNDEPIPRESIDFDLVLDNFITRLNKQLKIIPPQSPTEAGASTLPAAAGISAAPSAVVNPPSGTTATRPVGKSRINGLRNTPSTTV